MRLALLLTGLALYLTPALAAADDPCHGVRIDADASCEQRVSVGCSGSCDTNDFLFACAAELAASCKAECDIDASVLCTGSCDASCAERCRVDEVVCDVECAKECATSCVDQCSGADNPNECRASCEATCDTECDEACAALPVDATCQQHCEECCFGSCSAQINFDCQIGCQGDDFAACKEGFRGECGASCGVDGAVYCDGQYVAGGDEISECTEALEERGVEVKTKVDVVNPADGFADGIGFCAVQSPSQRGSGWLAGLFLLLVGARRRRRV